MTRIRLGVDLGGTKIECVAMAADGAIIARRRTPTPQSDYQATIDAIVTLICEVEADCASGPSVIGLGTPGSISPFSGLLRNSNSTHLNGRPFGVDLAAALGDRPLRIENDANCFAVSEAADGAASGAHVVFGVILGTGVGGGVV
ncbi:MAG: ROK family protein, partial [Pseudomonadota bacterium]